MAKRRIGDVLLESKLITQEQLEIGLRKQKEEGGRLGAKLIELGFVTDSELAEGLAKSLGIPFINIKEMDIKREILYWKRI